MQGTIFVTTYTFSNTPRDEWIAVILAFLISLPFLFMYIKLSAIFPNDTLIKIHDKVYGNVLGKAVSALYCLYLIIISGANFRFPSAFLNAIFMIDTPTIVFAFFIMFLCILAAHGGIETISRVGFFTAITVLFSLVLYFLLLLNKMELGRFFPILDVPPPKMLQSVLIISSQYIGENFIFAMILPFVSDKSGIKKNYLIGSAVGMLTFLIIAVLTTSVLGNVAAISTGPLVETTRHVEVLNILWRTEFIFMASLVSQAFFKCSVVYYITLISVSELLKLRSYHVLLFPLGLLILSLVMTMAENGTSMATAGRNSWIFVSIFFLFLLPLVTFVTAVIRTLPKKRGGT
jgi:spore germination protein KB